MVIDGSSAVREAITAMYQATVMRVQRGLQASGSLPLGAVPFVQRTGTERTVAGFYANPDRGKSTSISSQYDADNWGALETLVRVDVPLVFAVSPQTNGVAMWTPLIDGYIEYPAATTLVPFGNDLRPRQEPLLLYFGLTEYFTAESPNRCITAMTRGTIPSPKPWCGAVLVLKLAASQYVDFADVQRKDRKDIRGYYARLQ